MMKPTRRIRRTGAALAACSALVLSAVAFAQPGLAGDLGQDGWEAAVDEASLSELRGGATTVDQTNIGSSPSQTATNVLVGDAPGGNAFFAPGSLSGNSMSMTVVNTGNNNIMQNSMNVQVNFHGM